MALHSKKLKNLSRGSNKFHYHRLEIVRDLLDGGNSGLAPLSPFLRDRLFRLEQGSWRVFAFGHKDWPICERLLATDAPAIEARLLALVSDYVTANLDSVRKLYELSSTISNRMLVSELPELEADSDQLSAIEAQSLFAIRVACAASQASADAMRARLNNMLSASWARARLIHPLVYQFSHTPSGSVLDSFLSYIVTGHEHDAERLALKLILSDEAARETSLAFKIWIGLVGHPFDALEFVLDHIEYLIAEKGEVPEHLFQFLTQISVLLPDSRAAQFLHLIGSPIEFIEGTRDIGLRRHFDLSDDEIARYIAFCDLSQQTALPGDEISDRAIGILSNMRSAPYPVPLQFQLVTQERAIWFFIDAGRFVGALLRSIYMVDRSHIDLEARGVLRLVLYLGFANPFVATAPSAMPFLRSLLAVQTRSTAAAADIETRTEMVVSGLSDPTDRLWINVLQWKLRRLQEQGRLSDWLATVRSETKLRPSFLTGINWHWVDEVVRLHRLKPFKSFDGAYLFIHMELEWANPDPLRLRLTLEPLIRGLNSRDAVLLFIKEFGIAAQAVVRRFLTTQTLLASGLAPNYMAALDQRVQALEDCIKEFNFSPLLTEDAYEAEAKALTAELLLTNVNTGKFEVPWDMFRKDAMENQEGLFDAAESLRPRFEEASLTAFVETPITFKNGRTEQYRVRNRQAPLFALLMALISDYIQHPAFGLEIILSGRFRHNALLQEIWNAIAEVSLAVIPPVAGNVKEHLIEGYKETTEEFIDEWCSTYMQTARAEKSLALFDLVPTQKEIDELIVLCDGNLTMSSILDVVVNWIKRKLRIQASHARDIFARDVPAGIEIRYLAVSNEQMSNGSIAAGMYREIDVNKVHDAMKNAVLRKIDELFSWFDGVDTAATTSISLADLGLAAEALFENMRPGRTLAAIIDPAARNVSFEPGEVKIAFEMLREIYFNALMHGVGPSINLKISPHISEYGVSFEFANTCEDCSGGPDAGSVGGHRYQSVNDALMREGNSGLAKIAASAATLVHQDTNISWNKEEGEYRLIVPLRSGSQSSQ